MGIGYAMLPFLGALLILIFYGYWAKLYGEGKVPAYLIIATGLGMLTAVFGGYFFQGDDRELIWAIPIALGAITTVVLWIIGYVKRPK